MACIHVTPEAPNSAFVFLFIIIKIFYGLILLSVINCFCCIPAYCFARQRRAQLLQGGRILEPGGAHPRGHHTEQEFDEPPPYGSPQVMPVPATPSLTQTAV